MKDLSELSMSNKQRRAFDIAQEAARKVIRRRMKLLRLTKDAYVKLGKGDGALARVALDLQTMLRLSRSWARREYRAVPWRALVYVVGAVVYFVNPVDLIPDVLTGLGFVDDAAVIAAVVRSVNAELVAFRNWERATEAQIPQARVQRLSAAA